MSKILDSLSITGQTGINPLVIDTTKLVLDTSGNLGIGISPSYLLDVANTGQTRIAGGLLVGATETGGYITSGDHKMQILGDNATQGLMTFIGGSGLLQIWKDTTPSIAWAYGLALPGGGLEDDLIFSRWSPGWSEAFRVQNSTGFFGIGTSNPISALHIGDSNSSNADITIIGGGSQRNITVEDTFGPGSILNIVSGSATGPGADGGSLQLTAGASGSSNGGHVYINGGTGGLTGNVNISDQGGFCVIGSTVSFPLAQLFVTNPNGYDQFTMETSYTVTSNGDTNGNTPGNMAWDADYLYLYTPNGWGRVALDFGF